MMRRHIERLVQQLELTDDQWMQVRTLLGNHAKEAIRLRADIGVMAVDLRQLSETDQVDLPKAKQLLQSIAGKEVDVRLAHITLMQEISTLLTPGTAPEMPGHAREHNGAWWYGGYDGYQWHDGPRAPRAVTCRWGDGQVAVHRVDLCV